MMFDKRLDLALERTIDVPRERVWAAWTRPEQVVRWFAPAPWSVASCEIDLRPGGKFNTVMRSPEGEDFPNSGCYLEVIEHERLVFTDALLSGYRPSPNPFFTAILTLEPRGQGTLYRVTALHPDEATRARHEEMGFHVGWGAALDQLIAHARTM